MNGADQIGIRLEQMKLFFFSGGRPQSQNSVVRDLLPRPEKRLRRQEEHQRERRSPSRKLPRSRSAGESRRSYRRSRRTHPESERAGEDPRRSIASKRSSNGAAAAPAATFLLTLQPSEKFDCSSGWQRAHNPAVSREASTLSACSLPRLAACIIRRCGCLASKSRRK